LTYKLVREVLRVHPDDIRLESVEEHEDNFLILQFSDVLPRRVSEAATKARQVPFLHATAWLREIQ